MGGEPWRSWNWKYFIGSHREILCCLCLQRDACVGSQWTRAAWERTGCAEDPHRCAVLRLRAPERRPRPRDAHRSVHPTQHSLSSLVLSLWHIGMQPNVFLSLSLSVLSKYRGFSSIPSLPAGISGQMHGVILWKRGAGWKRNNFGRFELAEASQLYTWQVRLRVSSPYNKGLFTRNDKEPVTVMATNGGVHTLLIRTEIWARWVPDPFCLSKPPSPLTQC